MRQLGLFFVCACTLLSVEIKEIISFQKIQNNTFKIDTFLQENETEEFILELQLGYCHSRDNVIMHEVYFLNGRLGTTLD